MWEGRREGRDAVCGFAPCAAPDFLGEEVGMFYKDKRNTLTPRGHLE